MGAYGWGWNCNVVLEDGWGTEDENGRGQTFLPFSLSTWIKWRKDIGTQ
jgi:hypothetical protein